LATDPEQLILDAAARATKYAPDGDPDGYANFYMLRMNLPLPKHGRYWIEEMYKAHADGMGLIAEAFRGSTKTTILTNNFTTYRIGLEPIKRNLILRAADDKAGESLTWIASTIENDPAWKLCFPNIVPDKDSMWSAKGYNVKRTDMPYSDWTRKIISQDPCFTGYGITSNTYLGSHPDGVLALDDLNTKDNTYSDKDRKQVQTTVQEAVFPMIVPDLTWYFYCGTPWRDDDLLNYLKATKDFRHVYFPAQEDGREDGKPMWPEKWSARALEGELRRMGSRGYICQMLLNTKAAMGQILKLNWLHTYPADKIDPTWEKVMGVDYASTQYELGEKEKDRFSLTLEYLIPGGGTVVYDGFVDNLSQGEAEQKVMQWAEMYSPKLIGVENLGTGRELYSHLIRSTRLPVVPSGLKNKNIGYWIETELAPLCQFGRVLFSSADTEFLSQFREEWVGYKSGAKHDDTLASTWHATKMAMPNLENITNVGDFNPVPKKKLKHPAVWLAQAE
jgi:hypothetical protein